MLDSAIRYEYLKPVAVSLKLENEQLLKENLSLRILNDLKDKNAAQDKQFYQSQLAILRRKGNKKLLTGAALGALGTLIILKL